MSVQDAAPRAMAPEIIEYSIFFISLESYLCSECHLPHERIADIGSYFRVESRETCDGEKVLA